MVDTTRHPGTAYWLTVAVGLPVLVAAGCLGVFAAWPEIDRDGALALGAAAYALGAIGLSRLPRVARMRGGARAAWALAGAALAGALGCALAYAVLIALLVIACHQGHCLE